MRVLMIVTALLFSALAVAEETHPNITTSYGTLSLRDGVKLQTIVTKPANASGRLPALLFVQWLSCDSIELAPNAQDGWIHPHSALARSKDGAEAALERRQSDRLGDGARGRVRDRAHLPRTRAAGEEEPGQTSLTGFGHDAAAGSSPMAFHS